LRTNTQRLAFRADARNCFKEELPVRDLDRKMGNESVAKSQKALLWRVSEVYRTNEQAKQDERISEGRR